MKLTLSVLALFVVCTFSAGINPNQINAALFTGGFFDGLNSVLAIQPFTPCFVINFEVISQIDRGVKAIATWKIDQILEGIAELGEAFQTLPEAVASCQGAAADVRLIKESLQIFKNPKLVGAALKNLLANGEKVKEQLRRATNARHNENYLQYGNAVGHIVGYANKSGSQSAVDLILGGLSFLGK